jgi:hypothetical protein
VDAGSEQATLKIISPTTDEEWRNDRQESPRNDLCIQSILWVHFFIIDDHVTIPGTSWSHNGVPNVSAGVCSNELTKGIDGAKPSARSTITFEDQRGDGNIHARSYVTAEKSGGRTGVDEEWAAVRIVKAGSKGSGIDGASGAPR